MPQLILFLLIAGAGWLLYRRFVREAERLAARSKRREAERASGSMGTLIKDPSTGEYRLKREE